MLLADSSHSNLQNTLQHCPEKLFEFHEKLSRQSLVMCQYQCWFCISCTTLAIVKVLPEPVTPNKVWYFSPNKRPFESFSIACGWSPVGLYSDCIWKFMRQVFLTKIRNREEYYISFCSLHNRSVNIFRSKSSGKARAFVE